MENNEYKDLLLQLYRINDQLSAYRRTQSFTRDGETYHPAEMNILLHIHESPQTTVSALAEDLCISRSAASQLIKKLGIKGLILKKRNLMNERVINLSLSSDGTSLVRDFMIHEKDSLYAFYNLVNETDEEDRRIARGFLFKLEKILAQNLDMSRE